MVKVTRVNDSGAEIATIEPDVWVPKTSSGAPTRDDVPEGRRYLPSDLLPRIR
jgi:hypothetical protein